MNDFIKGTALMFYELKQEKRKIEYLISAFNAKELTFETDQFGEQNVHEMDMNTLETVLAIALSKEDSDFDRVFIKLLKIRLDELIKEKVEQKSYLMEAYKEGNLRWMDNPFCKLISEMNIGLLNNNLSRLREGYYKKECKGLEDTWIWILEKELKTKQAKKMESKMWLSSDGPIHVEKMNKSHIKNCIQRLEKTTKKGFFELNWLGIFYKELKRRKDVEETVRLQEAQKRQEVIRREEEKQRKIAFTDKVWEAYKNRNLIVEITGDSPAIVQELSVKQLNYGIKEFTDDTMIAILRKELETRNIACLDDYDNDKLFLYGRNVSYMNLTNVSDGIDTIEKNTEYYLENLLECMKHRRKIILFNHREYEAIKADLVDLSSYGLERLKELYGEIKCSNDPIERKLCGLYAKAIIVAEEKREIGDNMMKRYNAGELTFAYTPVDGKPGTSYIQDMHLEDIINARLTTSGRDYHPAWKEIFALEFEKRINANRQAEKTYNFAKRYGAYPSTLKKISPEMYEKELKELLNILRTFRI